MSFCTAINCMDGRAQLPVIGLWVDEKWRVAEETGAVV